MIRYKNLLILTNSTFDNFMICCMHEHCAPWIIKIQGFEKSLFKVFNWVEIAVVFLQLK